MNQRDQLLSEAASSTRKALHLLMIARSSIDPALPTNAANQSRIARALSHLEDAQACVEAIPPEFQK